MSESVMLTALAKIPAGKDTNSAGPKQNFLPQPTLRYPLYPFLLLCSWNIIYKIIKYKILFLKYKIIYKFFIKI